MATWLHSQVRHFPFTANALVAGACTSCGDLITQRASEWSSDTIDSDSAASAPGFDARRNLAFAIFGALWTVPGRLFYGALARRMPSDTLASAVKGALVTELVLDLPITVPAFSVGTDVLRGRDAPFAMAHLRRDYPACAASSFGLWFPATVVNLRLVPLQYRVMYDSALVVVWSSVFSFVSNRRAGYEERDGK